MRIITHALVLIGDWSVTDLDHFWRRAISRVARETLFREMNDSATAQILTCTAKVLDDMKVDWWLTDGTLLGFVRDNAFIAHDADVDIGVSAKDYTPALERRLAAAGLELYARGGQPDNGYEITLRSRWLYLPGTSLDRLPPVARAAHAALGRPEARG